MIGNLWVVDYDIPVESATKRRAFYRALHRILKENNLIIESRSTLSVWIVNKEVIARQIHALAKRYGSSHLYTANQIE